MVAENLMLLTSRFPTFECRIESIELGFGLCYVMLCPCELIQGGESGMSVTKRKCVFRII